MTRSLLRNKLESGLNATPAHHSKFRDVYTLGNLQEAAKKVIANKGTHGSDEVTVTMLKSNLDEYLTILQQDLVTGRYTPKPTRKVNIPKGDNEYRTLTIPTVIDRVAQQALLNIIEPPFEEIFMDCSYGFRKGRGSHGAIDQVLHYIGEGYHWVVKGDISNYFNTIPHENLLAKIRAVIEDEDIIHLIVKMIDGEDIPTSGESLEGLAQGSVISPLLANIYLHEFDKYMLSAGVNLVRYADDYVILFKNEDAARTCSLDSHTFLTRQLNLQSKDKDGHGGITHLEGKFNFLGYTFYPGGMKPASKALIKLLAGMEMKLKKNFGTDQKGNLEVEEVIVSIEPIIKGWINYFGKGNGAHIFKNADIMVRDKVREWSKWSPRPIPNKYLTEAGLTSICGEFHRMKR